MTEEGATEGEEAIVVEGGTVETDHKVDLDAWVHAIGGPKKGRLIGFGPRVDTHSILGSSSTTPPNWESQYCATNSQADACVDKLARQLEEERPRIEEALCAMQQQQQPRKEEHAWQIQE